MIDLKTDLENFRFQKKSSIILKDGNTHPVFDLIKPIDKLEGNVYLWVVEKDNEPHKIIYIGKAGNTLSRRCSQHRGGLKEGRSTGKKNLKELLKVLNDNSKITIYARHSDKIRILEEDDISLCDAEERALIVRYRKDHPLLNKL